MTTKGGRTEEEIDMSVGTEEREATTTTIERAETSTREGREKKEEDRAHRLTLRERGREAERRGDQIRGRAHRGDGTIKLEFNCI